MKISEDPQLTCGIWAWTFLLFLAVAILVAVAYMT
jgi:hypothetical protein